MMKNGDVTAAVSQYKADTGREISPVSIQKFIAGERKFIGDRPGSHQGIDIFKAIAKVVEIREQKAKGIKKLSADILASTRQACTASY